MQEHTIVVTVLGAILAFVLSPGLFVRIPKNGSLKTVAIVHTLVFAAVFFLLQQIVDGMLARKEGIATGPPNKVILSAKAGALGATNTGPVSTSATNTTNNQVTTNSTAPVPSPTANCAGFFIGPDGSKYCKQ